MSEVRIESKSPRTRLPESTISKRSSRSPVSTTASLSATRPNRREVSSAVCRSSQSAPFDLLVICDLFLGTGSCQYMHAVRGMRIEEAGVLQIPSKESNFPSIHQFVKTKKTVVELERSIIAPNQVSKAIRSPRRSGHQGGEGSC